MTALIEERAYEFPEIWEEGWFDEQDHQRVRQLAELIPSSVTSLLDVGCGGGLFLNHLMDRTDRAARLVGTDRSSAALRAVRVPVVRAAIDRLPFASRSFDAVSCMEVLEHLPPPVHTQAIAELARVARDWIIVSVPYEQDLIASQCRCPVCQTSFNPDFHMRSFDERALRELLTAHGFAAAKVRRLGESVERYDHILRNGVRQLFRREAAPAPAGPPAYAICPVCGFHDAERLSAELRRRRDAHLSVAPDAAPANRHSVVRRWLQRVLPRRASYRWIAAVYQRTSPTARPIP